MQLLLKKLVKMIASDTYMSDFVNMTGRKYTTMSVIMEGHFMERTKKYE